MDRRAMPSHGVERLGLAIFGCGSVVLIKAPRAALGRVVLALLTVAPGSAGEMTARRVALLRSTYRPVRAMRQPFSSVIDSDIAERGVTRRRVTVHGARRSTELLHPPPRGLRNVGPRRRFSFASCRHLSSVSDRRFVGPTVSRFAPLSNQSSRARSCGCASAKFLAAYT